MELLQMSNTYLKDLESFTLTRSFSILLSCQICDGKTNQDPLSYYNFGPCCSTCYISITRRYNQFILENNLEKNNESEQMYINLVKDALGKH